MYDREQFKDFDVKKVVMGRGHDCGGLICDLYFKRKKVATFHDDGWGGEPEIRFEVETDEIKQYFKDNNFAQTEFDQLTEKGYTFFKSVDEVSFDWLVQKICEQLAHIKQIDKDCKKAICVGSTHAYTKMGFTNTRDLKELLAYSNGIKLLQETYDEAKATGKSILNDPKQLKELGVKL